MNKSDIIKALAQNNQELSYSQIKRLTDSLFLSMAQALSSGQRIEVRGFGALSLKTRNGKVINPAEGTVITTRKRYVIHFRAGKKLAKRVDFKNN